MNHRAFSLLRVKSADDEKREIVGIATTPEVDRVGDIVEPLGMRYNVPMPLLLNHHHEQPVGQTYFQRATSEGIPFRATLPKVDEPGVVKDRIDEAWHSLKHRLIGAVSVGFRVLPGGVEPLESGGLRFTKTECLELSLCSVPANPSAVITGIKSIDVQLRAAYGQARPSKVSKRHDDTAAMAKVVAQVIREHVGKSFRPLADRIAALEQRKSFEYRGTWSEDESYEVDNFVTHQGSMWHTNEPTRSRPGTAGSPWLLCVKRGKDAR